MRQSSQDGVEHRVEMLAHVFGQEPQDEVAVLLQQAVLAAIAAVGLGIGQVLPAVEFDGDARLGAQQIDFHLPPAVKGNRQLGVQAEPAGGFRQRLQPPVQERLGGTAAAVDALRRPASTVRAAWTNRFASGASTPSRISRRTLAA